MGKPIKFGTDGWRAIIGDDYTFENVERVMHAYARLIISSPAFKSDKPIPIGYDRRFLSREFAERAAETLSAHGLKTMISKSYCPTPCISWMTKETHTLGGVMITASHNPFNWNGVKFKESYGGSASPEFTQKVEQEILKLDLASLPQPNKNLITSFDPHEAYVKQLRSQIDVDAIRKAGWKIAYDPLYGAGSGYLAQVLGMPVQEIHHEANPSFGGINPEPIDKNLTELMALVPSQKMDVGLATDGDADRIGAVDEKGRFVNSHQIFTLLLKHLIEKGNKGDIIKTVSTTQMIDKMGAKYGFRVHEVPIGFKHICNKFLEVTPLIGGEESGGIGIPSHVYERDGLLCALLLLEIMTVKKKRLGALIQDLFEEIGPHYFDRYDAHLQEKDLVRVREALKSLDLKEAAGKKVLQINRLDGVKVLLEDQSWLLLRSSGTEPLVRIYAESSNPEMVKKLLEIGQKLIS